MLFCNFNQIVARSVYVSTATFHMTPPGCLILARALTHAPCSEPRLRADGMIVRLQLWPTASKK